MNDLLNLAVEAHGGLKRGSQLTVVKASISITGELWQLKAQPEVLKDVVVVAQLFLSSCAPFTRAAESSVEPVTSSNW
jgi:hypothetical protein